MRPFGLFVAVCLFVSVLYCRTPYPFASGIVAAAADPRPAAQTSSNQETRLQKLQHYQVASQLLEKGLAKYRELRTAELHEMIPDLYAKFRKQLNKDLQPTWDRMRHPGPDSIWRESRDRTEEELKKEDAKRDLLDKQVKSLYESLLDPRTDNSKDWGKQFENHPAEKESQIEAELVNIFIHERDEAGAALK